MPSFKKSLSPTSPTCSHLSGYSCGSKDSQSGAGRVWSFLPLSPPRGLDLKAQPWKWWSNTQGGFLGRGPGGGLMWGGSRGGATVTLSGGLHHFHVHQVPGQSRDSTGIWVLPDCTSGRISWETGVTVAPCGRTLEAKVSEYSAARAPLEVAILGKSGPTHQH